MRKVLSVIAAVGILSLGFAGIASAAPDSWTVLYTAGSGLGADFRTLPNSGGTGHIAVRPDGSDGFGTGDGTPLPPLVGSPAIATFYRPDWDLIGANPTYPWAAMRDYRAPITAEEPIKVWQDFVVWAAPGYTAPEIHLTFWIPNAASMPPNVLGDHLIGFSLQMTHAPEGYQGPDYFEFTAPNPGGATPQLLAHIVLPSAGAIGQLTFNSPQNLGYRFNFVTPEPASMMVLATGLTGLAGLISRRRRS